MSKVNNPAGSNHKPLEDGRRVLKGYLQKGKRFIPPIRQQFPFLAETSWIDDRLPELVWIALLINTYGEEGIDSAINVSHIAAMYSEDKQRAFMASSDFELLSSREKKAIVEELRIQGHLEQAALAMVALAENYPGFPMAFVCDTLETSRPYHGTTLRDLKAVLEAMYDRHTHLSVWTQATAIWIAIKNGQLSVASHVSLARLSAINDYPHTDESRKVAFAIINTINIFLAQRKHQRWVEAFWGRGFVLEACEVS